MAPVTSPPLACLLLACYMLCSLPCASLISHDLRFSGRFECCIVIFPFRYEVGKPNIFFFIFWNSGTIGRIIESVSCRLKIANDLRALARNGGVSHECRVSHLVNSKIFLLLFSG